MTIVDWILDWWLSALEVRVDLRTFVDDWGVMFKDALAFPRIWASLEEFTTLMDLAIDMSKTRLWSTEADARRVFRGSVVKVTLAARNLGAHQNFSRHCHNASLLARLQKMPQIWVRLRASHGPYRFKIIALHMMAWPRALHGISVVHLGANNFKPLRAGALRAVKADRKGANPFLHLATSAVQSDPEAWAILQTLRDVREHGCPDQVESLLGLFAHSSEKLPANGPTAILLTRISRLGWGVGGQGLVQDRFGTFSLMTIAWDELVCVSSCPGVMFLPLNLPIDPLSKALLMWICLSFTASWRNLARLTWFFFGAIWTVRFSPRMVELSSKQGLLPNVHGVMREMDFTTGLGFAHILPPVAPT